MHVSIAGYKRSNRVTTGLVSVSTHTLLPFDLHCRPESGESGDGEWRATGSEFEKSNLGSGHRSVQMAQL